MLKNPYHLLLVFLSIISWPIFGQQQSTKDFLPYYKKQLEPYQSWLQDIGLASALQATNVQIRGNRILLKIEIATTNPDTAIALWKQIKVDFRKKNAFSIEERLFLKMTHTFEIPYDKAILRISSKAKIKGIPAVDGSIRFDPGQKRIISSGFQFRSSVGKVIEIPAYRIKNESIGLILSTKIDSTRAEIEYKIYDQIRSKAETYFKEQRAAAFDPNMSIPLTFTVKNIKNEIVPKGNWAQANPYERLHFSIKFKRVKDKLVFDCIIDGKYGSSFWFLKPSSLDNYQEMGPRYQSELENYLNTKFEVLLNQWLED